MSARENVATGVEGGAEHFTDLYRAYFPRMVWYIRDRLDDRHTDYAEDLAQETFIRFWRYYAGKGKTGSYTLLTIQARSVVAAFYETRFSSERATDFADPLNAPLTYASSVYAAGMPAMAALVRDLEAAMERMTEASQAWRDQHKATFALRGRIDKSSKPEIVTRLEAQYEQAAARGDRLLAAFRDTCLRVGELRSEIEQGAGPRWNASSGGPDAPAQREKTAGALTSDPAVTHCPEGHLLDLENTNFSEDGARRCRTCKAQQAREWHSARRAPVGAAR